MYGRSTCVESLSSNDAGQKSLFPTIVLTISHPRELEGTRNEDVRMGCRSMLAVFEQGVNDAASCSPWVMAEPTSRFGRYRLVDAFVFPVILLRYRLGLRLIKLELGGHGTDTEHSSIAS
jgi:hypothetical protein